MLVPQMGNGAYRMSHEWDMAITHSGRELKKRSMRK